MSYTYTIGINELDDLIGRALVRGTTILIAGNPGAGKTTMAATICYKNAIRGIPCVYLTFHEDKKRFINQMKSFRMDFEELERRGLFRFYKYPIVASTSLAGNFLEEINKIVRNHKGILVIDSVTPLSKVFDKDIDARAMLQNYFYTLASLINGLVILISEIPFGQEVIGDIEFITDVAIILKHKIDKGMLVRLMEIRKVRGAPVKIAEVPFAIIDGVGIQVRTPPVLSEITPPRVEHRLVPPCRKLQEVIEYLHPGHYVYVVHPPDAQTPYVIPLFLSMVLVNKMRTLVISYKRSPRETLATFFTFPQRRGDANIAGNRDLRALLERRGVIVEAINPAGYSLEELYSLEHQMIKKYRPQAIVMEGSEVVWFVHGIREPDKYYMYLRNHLLQLRDLGILTIRVSALASEEMYYRESSIADIIMKFMYRERGGEIEPYLYIWKFGSDPVLLSPIDIKSCVDECIGVIRRGLL